MAGVLNNTARPFNLKSMDSEGRRVTVRLKPGFNVVDDAHWKAVSSSDFVKQKKKIGEIEFGTKRVEEEAELEDDSSLADSKAVKVPKKKGSKD